jgi:hypothetical protein
MKRKILVVILFSLVCFTNAQSKEKCINLDFNTVHRKNPVLLVFGGTLLPIKTHRCNYE